VSTSTSFLLAKLLGESEISWNGRPVLIQRRQTRALLYRLAVRPQWIAREQLSFLFWPDVDELHARRNLTHLLTHLRRALPDPKLLVTTPDRVRLEPQQLYSDVAAFSRICMQAKDQLSQAPLDEALQLYSGPLLPGFSLPGCAEYEAWLHQERRILEQEYLQLLLYAVEAAVGRRDYAASIQYAQRYLAQDELNEWMHRRLIELYIAQGDRSAAVRQYEACTAILEQELGVAPLPETHAALAASRTLPAPPVPELLWTTLPGLDLRGLTIPMVGRTAALAQLRRAFVQARQGKGTLLLITGEAGIGKSRLIQEFAGSVQGEAVVLAGAGLPGEPPLPYRPLVQSLGRAIHLVQGKLAVEAVWLAEAALILPELRIYHPNLPAPVQAEPQQARSRLYEALTRITLALAHGPQPLLLCLDDLHFADSATLNWLAYLGERLRNSHLLLIGAHRVEEPDRIAEMRRAFQRLGILNEIALQGLEPEAIARMLASVQSSRASKEILARHLHQATGGNAFFLIESLRSIAESNQWRNAMQNIAQLPLSQTVSETVARRLSRLNPIAQQLVESCAVLGLEFDYDLLLQTAGRSEVETVEGLDELCKRYLLREEESGYHFHHELLRRAVYRQLSRARRRLLHRRAAEALEIQHRTGLDQVSGQIAAHYAQANLPDRALPFYARAAQHALQLFAYQEGIDLLATGLNLLKTLPVTPGRQRGEIDLQLMLGASLLATRGFAAAEAKQAYERAWQIAQQIPQAPEAFPALWGVWSYYNTRGDMDMALVVGRQLLDLAMATGDEDHLLEAYRALGSTLSHKGEPALAVAYQEQALALYKHHLHRTHTLRYGADPAVTCSSLLPINLWQLGYPEQAFARAGETMALAEEVGHPFSQAMALGFTALFHQFRRDNGRIEACVETVIALSIQHGFAQLKPVAVLLKGWSIADQGQYAAGIKLMEQGFGAWYDTGSKVCTPYWLYLFADLYARQGETGRALALIEEGLAGMQQQNERRGEPELHRLQAELLHRNHAPLAAVEEAAQRALAVARSQQAKSLELRAALSLCRIWQSAGKRAPAYELLHEIYSWFTEGFDTPDLQEAKARLESLG
jgi:DNA-binding SARP family transcriptional activator/predicted ATPase